MPRAIFSARAIVDADVTAVRRLALSVHPGAVGKSNAMLFADHGPATIEGSDGTFTYRSADSAGTVEVTDSTIRYTGGWWFRGTYTITDAGAGRAGITLLVENVARSPRWTVWLANGGYRGVRAELAAKFRTDVTRLAHAVGASSQLQDHDTEVTS